MESLLERCLQLGAIAKTVYHLLYLVRVIRTEVSLNSHIVLFLYIEALFNKVGQYYCCAALIKLWGVTQNWSQADLGGIEILSTQMPLPVLYTNAEIYCYCDVIN